MTVRIRALVADDEQPGRDRVLELLSRDPDVEIAGVAADGEEAVALIKATTPLDLLFLDIQMPKLDGFGVLRKIAPTEIPMTIFITAFDNFAIRAFEAHALDYLLKPFSDERFEATMQRAKNHISNRAVGNAQIRLARLLEEAATDKSCIERIILKSGGRITFLDVGDIDWIEAEGVYVSLHVGTKKYLYRATLGQMQQKLDATRFVRISRSVTVNVDRIRELQPQAHGNHSVVLKNGAELTLTKGYRPDIETWLKQEL
jgi:two-component system LytT family response regulator